MDTLTPLDLWQRGRPTEARQGSSFLKSISSARVQAGRVAERKLGESPRVSNRHQAGRVAKRRLGVSPREAALGQGNGIRP